MQARAIQKFVSYLKSKHTTLEHKSCNKLLPSLSSLARLMFIKMRSRKTEPSPYWILAYTALAFTRDTNYRNHERNKTRTMHAV